MKLQAPELLVEAASTSQGNNPHGDLAKSLEFENPGLRDFTNLEQTQSRNWLQPQFMEKRGRKLIHGHPMSRLGQSPTSSNLHQNRALTAKSVGNLVHSKPRNSSQAQGATAKVQRVNLLPTLKPREKTNGEVGDDTQTPINHTKPSDASLGTGRENL